MRLKTCEDTMCHTRVHITQLVLTQVRISHSSIYLITRLGPVKRHFLGVTQSQNRCQRPLPPRCAESLTLEPLNQARSIVLQQLFLPGIVMGKWRHGGQTGNGIRLPAKRHAYFNWLNSELAIRSPSSRPSVLRTPSTFLLIMMLQNIDVDLFSANFIHHYFTKFEPPIEVVFDPERFVPESDVLGTP
ncbi:hypothetical protein J6590_032504 [Homalodisca vitripennis]|nr:hypothetical protein J6590_032504 [Homalodisca vitripennis]